MVRNNTGHDWTVRGGKPENSDEDAPRCLRARSPNGRVIVEVDQSVGQFRDPFKRETRKGTHYPVSVYESTHYDYFPQHDDGEFISHELVAHVRPSTNGQGWAPSYSVARNLLLNAVLAIEADGKWISGAVDDPEHEFAYPGKDEETVREKVTELVKETPPGANMTREDLIAFARENKEWDVAEYVFSLGEADYEEMMWHVHDALHA